MKHACEKVSCLASAEQERQLSLVERFSMQFHFLMCSACKAYSVNITKIHKTLQMSRALKTQDEALPKAKRDEIRQSIQSLTSSR